MTCWLRVTDPIVLDTFRRAMTTHGTPASTLTDNGMVFTTRLSGGRGGRNALEHELRRLHITQNAAPQPHGIRGSYARTIYSNVRAALSAAVDDEHLPRNPCAAPRSGRRPSIRSV